MIWPAIGADLNAMAAPIIGAIHQQAANAYLSHFAQDDFRAPGRVEFHRQGDELENRDHEVADDHHVKRDGPGQKMKEKQIKSLPLYAEGRATKAPTAEAVACRMAVRTHR